MRTYAQAKEETLAFLMQQSGWYVHIKDRQGRDLKIPYAIAPCGERVDFKAQAVYLDGHSLFIDLRKITPGQFVTFISNRMAWRAIASVAKKD